MIQHYFAVDLGATSGRTILGTFDGKKMEMREITRFANPMIPIGGHLYWDLPGLYNEVLKGLRKIASESIEISSIGIDTWGCDFALFGKDGQLLGLPHCYRDQYTIGAQERFFEKMPASLVYEHTGIQFMDFNSLFQLDTQKRLSSSALEAADKILFIPDALTYMLTGKAICEYTVASTSQMLNPMTGELDKSILEALEVSRDKFGVMTQPGTIVGTLTTDVQKATGLGPVSVIAVAGHDTASAVASVPASSSDYAYLSCGTWSLLGIESSKAIISEDSFRENFTNEGGVEGTTRFLKNICGLWLFEQCRKEFKDIPSTVSEIIALCEKSSYNGIVNPDDPTLVAPESMTAAIRNICLSTGQQAPETPADYCRCIFRSLAKRYKEVIDILESMCGFKIKKLHVIGGGSQNGNLMQYTADELGIPVICGPVEGTALGNVLMQMKASGHVKGLKEMREIARSSVELVTYTPGR